MSNITCLLCKNVFQSIKYNINEKTTDYSNVLFRTLLEDVFDERIMFTTYLYVCGSCVRLLNELDHAKINYEKIRKRILNYLGLDSHQSNSTTVCCDADDFKENRLKSDLRIINRLLDDKGISHELEAIPQKSNKSTNNVEVKNVKDEVQSLDRNDECLNSNTEQLETKSDDFKSAIEKDVKSSKLDSNKHLETLKPYKCTQCPKTWKTLGELKCHLLAHNETRPYVCEICGQSYKHKTAFNIHVGMHNGIYPFTCTYCKKVFTQKGALQRHLPLHTGEAPYQCHLCGKRFVHHTSFNIHQLSHSGQKDHKCAVCGLALLSGSHLKRHMRVHTGERNYVCTFCGKRFAERYNLMSHQKLHEEISATGFKRKYRCQYCGSTFNRKLILGEHIAKEHEKLNNDDEKGKINMN